MHEYYIAPHAGFTSSLDFYFLGLLIFFPSAGVVLWIWIRYQDKQKESDRIAHPRRHSRGHQRKRRIRRR